LAPRRTDLAARRARLLAWIFAVLCCADRVAAAENASAGRWAGEIELPVLWVRDIRPDGGTSSRSLAKFEIERIRKIAGGQIALKLEHEADIAFDRDDDAEHETKVELDRRWAPGDGGQWEKFVRGAFTAAGSFDDSVEDFDRFDLIAGVRRRRANRQVRSSIELRVGRRHDFADSAQAWVPGMKLKWSKSVREDWSLAAEAKLTAVLGSPNPNRVSGKVQFFLLRSFEPGSALQVGLMTFVSGAATSKDSTLRGGIGPVFVANW
jgi:hypothetical protein